MILRHFRLECLQIKKRSKRVMVQQQSRSHSRHLNMLLLLPASFPDSRGLRAQEHNDASAQVIPIYCNAGVRKRWPPAVAARHDNSRSALEWPGCRSPAVYRWHERYLRDVSHETRLNCFYAIVHEAVCNPHVAWLSNVSIVALGRLGYWYGRGELLSFQSGESIISRDNPAQPACHLRCGWNASQQDLA